jgi:hypothetical protein
MGPIRRAAAPATGVQPDPSTAPSPTAHQRPDRVRQAHPGVALRLLVCYDRIVGLLLENLAVDGSITNAPEAVNALAGPQSIAANRA